MESKAFPKIFHIGSPEVANLFTNQIEITEKVDGSQFAFGKDSDGKLFVRSKGAVINIGAEDKMFKPAVSHVLKVQDRLGWGVTYYAETLASPRHNTIVYSKVPLNNLALFGVLDNDNGFIREHSTLQAVARKLEIDVVPLVYSGLGTDLNLDKVKALLDKVSFLGNEKMEGVVVKNYKSVGGNAFSPYCFAKLVQEGFKERNGAAWRGQSSKSKIEEFIDSFANENRWQKAIQHLRDDSKLSGTPTDIGPLIVEIKKDVIEENEQLIKLELWKIFKEQIERSSVHGFPQWYKDQLLKKQFESKTPDSTGEPLAPVVATCSVSMENAQKAPVQDAQR